MDRILVKRAAARCLCSVAVVGVAFLGCAGRDSPTDPGDTDGTATAATTSPPGRKVTVTLAGDVAPAAVNAITTLVTSGDSVSAPKGMAARPLSVVADSSRSLIVALDASGAPIVAAFVRTDPNAPTAGSLSASSTAIVLARVLIPPGVSGLPDEETLQQLIAGSHDFPALANAVRANLARGTSYAKSTALVSQAAAVADGVVMSVPQAGAAINVPAQRSSQAPARRATISAALPSFYAYPVSVSLTPGTSPTVTFSNSAFIGLGLTVSPHPGTTDDLPGTRQCILCSDPSGGTTPGSTTYQALAPATLSTATVSFGAHGRNTAAMQGAFDLFSTGMRVVGASVPENDFSSVLDLISKKIDIHGAGSTSGWLEALQIIKDQLVQAAPDLAIAVAARAGVGAIAHAFFLPLAALDTRMWISTRSNYYSNATNYWNTPPEKVQICVAKDGTLWTACVITVHVTLALSSVSVGQTVEATAIGTDEAGDTVAGPPVQWAVTSGAASITPEGLVTPTGAGAVTVSATIDGVTGTATTAVAATTNMDGTWTAFKAILETGLVQCPAPAGQSAPCNLSGAATIKGRTLTADYTGSSFYTGLGVEPDTLTGHITGTLGTPVWNTGTACVSAALSGQWTEAWAVAGVPVWTTPFSGMVVSCPASLQIILSTSGFPVKFGPYVMYGP